MKPINSILFICFSILYHTVFSQWTENGTNLSTSHKVIIGGSNPLNSNLRVHSNVQFSDSATPVGGLFISNNSASVPGDFGGYISFSQGRSAGKIGAAIAAFHDVNSGFTNDRYGLAFYTHPTSGINDPLVEKMRIMPNGNVGINTVSPTHKLEVNGTIRSKEVKVEASPWPDYVFEPGYGLMPLTKLEAYIQENGHLPEVPSAATVNEQGIALGEMNVVLLKKIEELTLYVIELKKEIELLKN